MQAIERAPITEMKNRAARMLASGYSISVTSRVLFLDKEIVSHWTRDPEFKNVVKTIRNTSPVRIM